MREVAANILLEIYAPATVLVDKDYKIVHFFGSTANYFELPSGGPTYDLLSTLRMGLVACTQAAAQRAREEQQTVVDNGARVQRHGQQVLCSVTARPVSVGDEPNEFLLISFEDHKQANIDKKRTSQDHESVEKSTLVEPLEYSLKAAQGNLKNSLAEVVNANEKLQANTEKMMSLDDELRSKNQELASSKEELQSMNEELNTANSELQMKVDEIEASRDDFSNLLASTDIPTVFLDRSLNIKLFNPPIAKLLNVRTSDIGRPISDFSGRVNDDFLFADVQQVLDKLTSVDKIVSSNPGEEQHSYLRRIVHYSAGKDRTDGVVVTYLDITERHLFERDLEKRIAESTRELEKRKAQLSLVAVASGASIWEMDSDWQREISWEDTSAELFGERPKVLADTWGWWLDRVHADDRDRVVNSLQQSIDGKGLRWEQQYRFLMADHKEHWVTDVAYLSRDSSGTFQRFTGAMIDIDQNRQMESIIAKSRHQMDAITRYVAEALVVVNGQGVIIECNDAAEAAFGYSKEELLGNDISLLVPDDRRSAYLANRDAFPSIDKWWTFDQHVEHNFLTKDGVVFPADVISSAVEGFGLFVAVIRDLSEQRRLEKEICNVSSYEQESTGRELHDGLGQRLTALNMLASHFQKKCQQEGLRDLGILTTIREQLKEAAGEVSRISRGLAPISIPPGGLPDALAQLVEQFDNISDVQCRFDNHAQDSSIDEGTAGQLYRIAQEALNNALKYAQAKAINLSLTDNMGALELAIVDDGIGFDLEELMQWDGIGIRIMRYRAGSIGAVLTVVTAPNNGTKIICKHFYNALPDAKLSAQRK